MAPLLMPGVPLVMIYPGWEASSFRMIYDGGVGRWAIGVGFSLASCTLVVVAYFCVTTGQVEEAILFDLGTTINSLPWAGIKFFAANIL